MSEKREPERAISVIVPVQNSGEELARLLDTLGRQTLPRSDFEVIVSDDGSAEPPVALATDDGHVKVVSGLRSSSYAARNRGVAAARGHLLAFCDADCVPDPAWLERGLEALEGADIVAGRIQFIVPDRVTVWTLIDMDTSKNQRQLVELGVGETANLFVRRELFERVGGFDPRFPSHGDYDFVERCVKSGARLAYSADAVVWHPTRDDAGGDPPHAVGSLPLLREAHDVAARAGRRSQAPLLGAGRAHRPRAAEGGNAVDDRNAMDRRERRPADARAASAVAADRLPARPLLAKRRRGGRSDRRSALAVGAAVIRNAPRLDVSRRSPQNP